MQDVSVTGDCVLAAGEAGKHLKSYPSGYPRGGPFMRPLRGRGSRGGLSGRMRGISRGLPRGGRGSRGGRIGRNVAPPAPLESDSESGESDLEDGEQLELRKRPGRRNTSSEFCGVSHVKDGRWQAQIGIKGRVSHPCSALPSQVHIALAHCGAAGGFSRACMRLVAMLAPAACADTGTEAASFTAHDR